ncbi:MAG: hypothetical protein Q4G48_09985, partial [Bacteroidia bacterium]|nr:hypothetical protein [Bacteroidia bacterium]
GFIDSIERLLPAVEVTSLPIRESERRRLYQKQQGILSNLQIETLVLDEFGKVLKELTMNNRV